jgi:hypothetical protein
VAITVLNQLKKSLRKSSKEENTPSSIQSLYEISPAGISEAFVERPVTKNKYCETITLDDFLIMAAQPFIDSVRPVKLMILIFVLILKIILFF